MGIVTLLLSAAAVSSPHPCIGDFVFRGGKDEVSIGARVRREPDLVEILFSDYGNVQAPQVVWNSDTLVAVDPLDKSNIVMVCSALSPTLILPKDEYNLARTFKLQRTTGSLWEVDAREGWKLPKH